MLPGETLLLQCTCCSHFTRTERPRSECLARTNRSKAKAKAKGRVGINRTRMTKIWEGLMVSVILKKPL